MATISAQTAEQLLTKVIEILSKPKRPTDYHNTFTAFCSWCQKQEHTETKSQIQILHKIISNKKFGNAVITHFKTFNSQIIAIKKSSKKPLDYTFKHFMQIINDNIQFNKKFDITDTEERIEDCLTVLINITESQYFRQNNAQIRSIFSRTNHNLFALLSSILKHCELYRLHLSNKLFRFLQHMLPPINTSKSKSFCRDFNIPILLDRCTAFMIYRMHIDGDGDIDKNKNNYNDLYGVETPLPEFIDSPISIVTYLVSSKWHKKYVFEHKQITSCIVTLCVRLCHEIQTVFNLKQWRDTGLLMAAMSDKSVASGLQSVINTMQTSIKKGEYIGHHLVIGVAMEYLYYYSLEMDIKKIRIPLGNDGSESFDECWIEYQYVVAILRLVTGNKILGLYLDTIANKMGYSVDVEQDVRNKKKKDLLCYQVYETNKMSCFYGKCNKRLDMKKKSKLKKCKGCQVAFYCNKKCQKMDWKYHKEICNDKNDDEIKLNDEEDIVCTNTDCANKESLRRCTGCYHVWYCGIKCQTEHWKTHKTYCKQKRKEIQVRNNMF